MTHPAEQLLQPRAFVLSANTETMVLQSQRPESRLTFLNSVSASSPDLFPRYAWAFSNTDFRLYANQQEVATFRPHPRLANVREALFHGSTATSNLQLLAPTTKAVILEDFNENSGNQFTGLGVTSDRLLYQLASRTHQHVFQAAASDEGNVEWMRIQESAIGVAQVGIGTATLFPDEALAVQGNARVTGDLHIAGNLSLENSQFVTVDPLTQRLEPSVLPERITYLNTDNKLDESILPQSYNFQYLKAQKNVGIGTRAPQQKLHVWGSAVVSERLGIGTATPTSRIEIVEESGVVPAVTVHAKGNGDAMRLFVGNNVAPSFVSVGTHAGVGIGTSTVQITNALEVGGDIKVHGNATCESATVSGALQASSIEVRNDTFGIIFKSEVISDANGVDVSHVLALSRFDFANAISTNTISSYSRGIVRFLNTSIEVDGDTILARQPLIRSDMRYKHEIKRIGDALTKLNSFKGYTYHFGDGQREAGVLAQEVLPVFPEAVSTANPDRYGVRYDSIIALLIEGIHELKKKIHLLEMQRM